MRIGSVVCIGLLGLAGCQAPQAAESSCDLQKISVVSTDPARNEVYVARAAGVEVQFRNENAPAPAEVFPDPRVTVRDLESARSCDIQDNGGIWSGRSVYLDTRARVLVLNAYSGSSDALIFYDPTTCQKLAELDVSGKRWEILGDRVRTGQECSGEDVASCKTIQELSLGARCLVTGNPKP
jgi:hypothetical protein